MSTIERLDHIVADATILAQKAKLCHWNVEGPGFLDYHEFFGEIYDYLTEQVDEFAERVRALDSYPVATYTEMLAMGHLKEVAKIESKDMTSTLLADFESFANEIRSWIEDEEDAITQDMFIGFVAELDKKSWMLRAMTKHWVQ